MYIVNPKLSVNGVAWLPGDKSSNVTVEKEITQRMSPSKGTFRSHGVLTSTVSADICERNTAKTQSNLCSPGESLSKDGSKWATCGGRHLHADDDGNLDIPKDINRRRLSCPYLQASLATCEEGNEKSTPQWRTQIQPIPMAVMTCKYSKGGVLTSALAPLEAIYSNKK